VATKHSPEIGASVEAFEALAKEYSIPFAYSTNLHADEMVELFRNASADVAVAALWPQTLRDSIIATTRLGFLNIHGANLPQYRGNACGNWAILEGETQFAACVHFMDPESLDSGPLLERVDIPITERMTIGELTERVEEEGLSALLRGLNRLANGDEVALPQNQALASRCYPRLPQDREIDWNQSSDQIDRKIRSVSEPYPGAYTFFRGEKLLIWRAHPLPEPAEHLAVPGHVVATRNDGTIWVATGDDGVLVIDEVQLEGEERTAPREIIKSIRVHLGLDTNNEIVALRARVEHLEEQLLELLAQGITQVQAGGNG